MKLLGYPGFLLIFSILAMVVLTAAAAPDPTEIINSATKSSWEAGMVVFFSLAVLAALVWIQKHYMNQADSREKRMAARIDELEKYILTNLATIIAQNTAAFTRFNDILSGRPCIAMELQKAGLLDDKFQPKK